MNWTEGNLARHSRPRKGRDLLLRQKEHFAKIRSGALNATVKISPPSISFLVHPAKATTPARHPSPRSKVSVYPSSKKRTSDEAPLQISRYFQADNRRELPTPADFHNSQAEDEALRQKRRKLLLKGDWTGISLQKPIEMEFSKPRVSVGNPWNSSKSRHMKLTSRTRHILGTKYDGGQPRALKAMIKTTRPTSRSQLRVRVGSRERVFGGSSNASPRSRTCRDVESSFRVSHESASKHDKRQPQLRHQVNVSISDSDRQSPESPVLHQPLPLRPFMPSLLRSQSSDPDDAASTKARVGVLEPDVPSSRADGNAEWFNFVGGAEHSSCASDSQPPQDQGLAVQREISPGVSQFGLATTIGNPEGPVESTDSPSAVIAETHVHSEPPAQREKGLSHSHELDGLVGGVSKEDDGFFTADESTSSSIGSSPPGSEQNPEAEIGVAPATRNDLPNHSDGLSLRVFPTSSSPTSEELLAQFCNYTNIRDPVDDVIVPHAPSGPHQPENEQDPLKLSTKQQGAATDQKQLPKPCNTKECESNMWREFVFEEFDNNLQEAFEEAKKETARNLQPSDSSITSAGNNGSRESAHLYPELSETTAALSSGHMLETLGFTDQHSSSSTGVSSMKSVSHMAIVGDSSPDPLSASNPPRSNTRATIGFSSPDPLSAPYPACSDMPMQFNEGITGYSSSTKDASLSLVDDFLSRSDAWSFVTGGQDDTSIIANPPSASEQSEADDVFKFAPPKPFLGKKIQLDESRQIALSAPQIKGKGVTWRRQKRTGDGRANIRNLPNFNSDPIEEVEEAVSNKGAQKPSLFASLDTEKGMF